MATMHTEERVGEAWKQHRMGNNSGAIEIFQDILSQRPGHLDALYGLGLAQRAEGKLDLATETFNKAAQLNAEALAALETQSVVDGHKGNNDLDTYEDDRFMMLSRMISQRLEEIEAAAE
ncbi:MAG: tetratricopeptide repeat protein [Phototrophicaceae bacterium]